MKKLQTIIAFSLFTFIVGNLGYAVVKESGLKAEAKHPASQAKKETAKTETQSITEAVKPDSRVVAYYFHGTARCVTCRDIESYTKEAIETGFPEAIKTKRLEFRVVNVDEPQNEHFVQDYQLSASSVVVVRFNKGEQTDWKNLQLVWELVPDHDAFMVYVQEETKAFLISSSTTRRTSERHHKPFGFLSAQSQLPALFSTMIFSIIRERPFSSISLRMSSAL
jgi:hypothetical protein